MFKLLLLSRPRCVFAFVVMLSFCPFGAMQAAHADTPHNADNSDLDEATFDLPLRKPDAEKPKVEKPKQTKAQKSKTPAPPTPEKDKNDEITVTKFRKLKWSPSTGSFSSEGSARLEYKDLDTKVVSQLTANNSSYDAATGRIQAKGDVRLLRPEGVFTGREIDFNLKTDVGFISDAFLDTEFFRMRGERIERKSDGTIELVKGIFTTCENERPDYRVRAGRLTLKPNPRKAADKPITYQSLTAKNITFYAGPTALISLPSYRRNLGTSSRPAIPNIGYNRGDGITFRQSDALIEQPHESLYYDARVNLKRIPSGFVTYQRDLSDLGKNSPPPLALVGTLNDPLRGYLEQLTPPTYQEFAQNRYSEPFEPRQTFFAILQNDLFSYTRRRTDLFVSRFPEVGVRWTNILGKRSDSDTPNPTAQERRVEGTKGILRRVPNAPFLVDFLASGGVFNEKPTDVTAAKIGMRLDIASQPLLIGKNLALRAAVSNQTALYSRGTAYNLFSPEVELNFVPDRNAIFGIGYRFAESVGRTPFAFDARDIRHELRLRAQYGTTWGIGFLTRYDLERSRAYDTELALVRNFDCMQVGVSYRFRSQQFSIIFNLLPPLPSNRANRRLAPEVGNGF